MACKLRIGSLNLGTLTGKFVELVDVLRKRRMDVTCIQDTRWKGAQSREANGYKLWYSGLVNSKNGVGILLSKELKDNVVEVKRCNDRIMSVRVVVGEKVVNLVCAYAPQAGLGVPEKEAFWVCLDELVGSIPDDQFTVLGGDFNGHIGERVDGYHCAHGGFGFGVRNEGGSALLEFATAHELVVVNSVFQMREHLITFSSGGTTLKLTTYSCAVVMSGRAWTVRCSGARRVLRNTVCWQWMYPLGVELLTGQERLDQGFFGRI